MRCTLGAVGEALLELAGMRQPQLQAMTCFLRVCGFMLHKIEDPSLRPLRKEFVMKTIAMCEIRLPLYLCTFVRHSVVHAYDAGGWMESIGPSRPASRRRHKSRFF